MDVKEKLTKIVCEQLGLPTDPKHISQYKATIWQNPRKKDVGGMRLTEKGFEVFTEQVEMKSYEIELPKDLTLTNQVVIWLDHFIDGPYYITKKAIIVFKEKTAVQLVLFSGNIQKFGLAKAMSMKNSSEKT